MPATFQRRQLLTGGAALAALGLPTLPAAAQTGPAPAAVPLAAWARSPLIDQIALAPDAQNIAIITQDGDQKFLQTVDRKGNKARTVNLGDIKVRDLMWADNDHLVLVTSTVAQLAQYGGFKQELSQATIIDPATGKGRMLWDHELDIASTMVVGGVGRIKTSDGYRVTAANLVGFENLCVASFPSDPDAPHKPNELTTQYQIGGLPCVPYNNFDLIIGPDGRIVATTENDFESARGVTKTWAVRWNTSPGNTRTLMKQIYRTTFSVEMPELCGIGADGNSVIIALYDDEAGWDYFTLFPNGTLSAPLDDDNSGMDRAPAFHPVTRRFCGFVRFGDSVVYDYTDPVLATIARSLPAAMGEGTRCRLVSFAEDPRQCIVHVEADDEAGSYYFLDLAGGANDFLGDDYPQIAPSRLSKRSLITYAAADGLSIPAYLTLPSGRPAKNLALVVLPHGGPQARDTLDYDWQAQALASRGYAVLQPNYRGSSGYGSAFLQAGRGEFGRKMQTDLSDGVRYLIAQGIVDARRVAIVGASYGGYAALAGATLDLGVYNSAVSIAGISDLKQMMQVVRDKGNSKYDSQLLYWDQYFGDHSRLGEISPIEHVDRVTIPVLLIHGKDDTVVEFEQSVRMEKALKQAGKKVEFITYEHQDHWETIESARIDMITRIVEFLGRHNPA